MKPTFRESFQGKRCLVVADGYYEWFARDKPYLIHRRDDGPFAMAGLWELWADGTERRVTCCLVTTPAAEWLRPIHDRMPLIVTPDRYEVWLDPGTPVAQLLGMLQPYAQDDLEAVRVTTTVNRVANDGPERIAPMA